MPYVTDLGAVRPELRQQRLRGLLDGFSIVNGHEYAETVTIRIRPAAGPPSRARRWR